jgi:hypothetical protein
MCSLLGLRSARLGCILTTSAPSVSRLARGRGSLDRSCEQLEGKASERLCNHERGADGMAAITSQVGTFKVKGLVRKYFITLHEMNACL